jgi:hypothetical protein
MPTHPIAPGGPPPQVWPGPGQPAHPIAPGGPPDLGIWPDPGYPAHPIAPGGEPPGIWGGPPSYIDIGFPLPQPPTGAPTHPIYLPPVIWPDQPEGYPSFDPDQIPGHPDLPDLNYGAWSWIDNDGVMERCFLAQVVRP